MWLYAHIWTWCKELAVVAPDITFETKKTGYFQREYDRLRTHPNEFKDLTRMTPELFDDLLGIIGHRLVKKCKREPICPTERLLITLM